MSRLDLSVLKQVADELGAYVYMLVDPRDRQPFYVGKGQHLRFDDHYTDALVPVADADDDPDTAPARIGASKRFSTRKVDRKSGSSGTG